MRQNKRLTCYCFSVGGREFSTTEETLMKYAPTYFSREIDDGWEEGLFIDRSPDVFEHVIAFLRGYTLDMEKINAMHLKQDAEFYEITPLVELCEAELAASERIDRITDDVAAWALDISNDRQFSEAVRNALSAEQPRETLRKLVRDNYLTPVVELSLLLSREWFHYRWKK